MTTKAYRVTTDLEMIPQDERVKTLDNRGQIYEWLMRYTTRDHLKDAYNINPLSSPTHVLLVLTRLGVITIRRTRTKKHNSYSPSMRGFLRVTLPNTQSRLTFTSRDRISIYDNLITCLYPQHRPTDRMFLAHMSAEINRRLTDDMDKETIVGILEEYGYLQIEGLKHAPK